MVKLVEKQSTRAPINVLVSVKPGSTIGAFRKALLKEDVFKKRKLRKKDLVLTFNGISYKPEKTLLECGVCDDDTALIFERPSALQ